MQRLTSRARRLAGRPPTPSPEPGSTTAPTLLDWANAAYVRHVADLVAAHGLDEGVALAIGGYWDETGPLLRGALELAGLGPDSAIVDVGCGAGRLPDHLPQSWRGGYLGTDVVPDLIAYARAHARRDSYRFEVTSTTTIPLGVAEADLACFFSVFTHLPHEAIYAYLAEAQRVLRPGGAIVASFLEFVDPALWPVFAAMVDGIGVARHHNQFVHRDDVVTWCGRLGLVPERFIGATEAVVPVRDDAGELISTSHFGQALMVLRRP